MSSDEIRVTVPKLVSQSQEFHPLKFLNEHLPKRHNRHDHRSTMGPLPDVIWEHWSWHLSIPSNNYTKFTHSELLYVDWSLRLQQILTQKFWTTYLSKYYLLRGWRFFGVSFSVCLPLLSSRSLVYYYKVYRITHTEYFHRDCRSLLNWSLVYPLFRKTLEVMSGPQVTFSRV